jgi:hypothetical protein
MDLPFLLQFGPVVRAVLLNSKHEIRNSKQIQMTKIQNSKQKRLLFWKFGHSNLGFVSDFDIRISDFDSTPIKRLDDMQFMGRDFR